MSRVGHSADRVRSLALLALEYTRLSTHYMTNDESDDSFSGTITSEETFEATLSELVATARRNGIDPLGSWVCRDDKTVSDMEVTIVELDDRKE